MCGRYSSRKDVDDLVREFEVQQVDVAEKLEPDYNVAPSKQVLAVLDRLPREPAGAEDESSEPSGPTRHLAQVKWGLVPFWSKDPKIGNRMINARVESSGEKPAFRAAFSKRRCLIPADGYYEWYDTGEQVGGKKRKQPFFIHPADGGTLAMAGLYEIWRDPEKAEDDPDRFLWTCTILTTTAEDSVGRIHDRMPLTLDREAYDAWLDPRITDPAEVRQLLIPAAPGKLDAYPVSTRVNNVRNNGPDLIEPIPAEDEQ